MRAFIDSNLWAYRLDQRNPGKSERIRHWLAQVCADHEVVTTDTTLVLDAHLLSTREQLSWLDALIAEAAIRSRCDVLFSEDFNHGGRIGALRLINPLVDR
ncbi:PIN domain-containing protein [Cyanobium sp. CH-040]|uniref:PIN domain-containing protein n=1 Tax=Cyanobium sp. CH-040 TaxID=2823708 RepID=UPI0020CE5F89|nr:PIN domain-containing protein [Cyanobium sp. CH-040]MCP9927520.1 hypothetical protein [Cyanobium sp. CH-040]